MKPEGGNMAGFFWTLAKLLLGLGVLILILRLAHPGQSGVMTLRRAVLRGVRVLGYDPAKGPETVRKDRLLVSRMIKALGAVERRIDLVSAWLVPGEILTGYFTSQAQTGGKIRALTNSQEATDVLPVKWLLQGGSDGA